MTITPVQMLVDKSKYGTKCPYSMNASFITFHNTANDASARSEVKYMIGNNHEVSYHFAVDDKEVVQGIPVNRNAWHTGDGSGIHSGNRTSIGVEVCYSKSGGDRYYKAEALAVKFIAQLLHERGWSVDRVKRHQEWSGKYCPHRVLAEGRWNEVKANIQKELNALNGKKTVTYTPAPVVARGYLKKGDKGDAVKNLQTLLNKAGYNCGVADGIFGAKTDTQVRKLQSDNHITVDGLAGNQTMQVLEAICDAIDAKAKASVQNVVEVAHEEEVYGTLKVIASSLNVREKADFNSKIVKVVKKGESYKVYSQKNGLYNLGGNQWTTANEKYVHFTKNPNYGKSKSLKVLAKDLYTYKTANWNDKGQLVHAGEVFTITKELMVNGSKMYQLKSGLFITANQKYVQTI